MVMQKDTKIYPSSGKRRTYVQRGGESSYYSSPKCLYRGEYKRGKDGDGENSLYYVCVVRGVVVLSLLYPLSGLPFYSSKERPRVHA